MNKNQIMKLVYLYGSIGYFFIFINPLFAQVPLLQPKTNYPTPVPENPPEVVSAPTNRKIVTFSWENTMQSNFRDFGTSNHELQAITEFTLDISPIDGTNIWFYTAGSKNLEGTTHDGTWEDSWAVIESTFYQGDMLTFKLHGKLILPTSENSNHINHMDSGYEIYPTFLTKLYKDGEFAITWRFRPIYQRFFYSEDINENDYPNIEQTFRLSNRLQFQFASWVSFFVRYDFGTKWNSSNERVNDNWVSWEYFEFPLNSLLLLRLGHANGGSMYNDSGSRNNVDLYNTKSSVYYATLAFEI